LIVLVLFLGIDRTSYGVICILVFLKLFEVVRASLLGEGSLLKYRVLLVVVIFSTLFVLMDLMWCEYD